MEVKDRAPKYCMNSDAVTCSIASLFSQRKQRNEEVVGLSLVPASWGEKKKKLLHQFRCVGPCLYLSCCSCYGTRPINKQTGRHRKDTETKSTLTFNQIT